MKGTVLLLCAITLAQAALPQLTLSGRVCHCSPEEATGVCSQYGSDNALIVHENCNQFYKCAHGAPVAYFCPGTTLYNPLAETCDWPQNVECGDRPIVPAPEPENENPGQDNGESGNPGAGNCNPADAPALCAASGSDGVLVAHEYCNWFYKCAHGAPVAMYCDTNLLYNPHTAQCDWPHNVDCEGKPVVEVEAGGDNDGEVDCEDQDNGSGGNVQCNCNPAEAPIICAAPGSDGVLVAHENCRQFYKCAHGVPVAFPCSGALLYNPYTQQCDWPNNVDCGDRYCPPLDSETGGSGSDNGVSGGDNGGSGADNGGSGSDNGSSGTDNGGSGTDNGGGTCNCNPGEAPGICAADGSDGVLVAHEHCNKFYKCDHGVPVAMNCYGELLYNPHTEQCDWPHLVDCGDRPIDSGNGDNGGSGTDNGGSGTDNGGSGTDNGGSGTDNGGSGTDNGGGTCNCNPGEAPGICAADGSDGVLVAHEHCNKFYKCDHGVPVAMNCYGELLYNPHTEQCDWPHLVDCGDRPIDSGNGDNGGSGTDNGGSGTDNGGSGTDNGGSGTDNGGSGTDNGGGTCNCNPGEAPGICAADGSDGVLVAHEHCNKFYKCDHGVPVAMNCYGELLYNPHTEQCDWPHLVDCGDRPIDSGNGDNGGSGTDNGGSGTDNGGSGTDNGGSGTDNGGSGTDNGGGTCNCNPGEAPGICAADGSDGVLIAHEHCNKFYKCDHGVPVAMNCYGELLYNPHTEQCDWPHLVDCGDRPIDSGIGDNGGSGTDNGGSGTDNGGSGTDNGGSGTDNGGSGTDNGGGTCNCNPGEAPGICAADGSDGVLVAHEHCNKFYKCDHGVPVAMNCYGELLYNPHTEQCDWPHLVDCGDRPIDSGNGDNGGSGTDNGGSGTDNGGSGTDNGGSGTDNGGSGTDNGGGTCNCNPGEAPGICAADGSDGVLVAHEHCNKFYKCDHGVPVAMNCYGELLYNPHTEQCDWPHLVDCGDRPIDSGNGDNGGSGTDNGGSGTDNGGSGTDNGGSGTDNGGGTCNCNPGEAPGICAADGSDGVLVAHEHCNKFYKCDHGVPVAMNCYGELLYNPHTEQCDWPHLVDCGDRPVVEHDSGSGDNGGGGTDSGNSDTDNGGSGTETDNNGNNNNTDEDCEDNSNSNGNSCNCNPDEAASICSVPGSDGTYVAHANCNQFYQCAHGIPVEKFCSGDLVYNPFSQRCDWPSVVDCGDRPIVENGGGNGDNGSGDNGGGDNGGTESGSCNCNPGEAPTICSAAGSDGTYVAHEHCNAFYICAHGVPVTRYCSGDLLYNPYTERCDWPHAVDCGSRPIVPVEKDTEEEKDQDSTEIEGSCDPSQAPAICATAGSDGVFVCHENCNQYYVCAHGSPVTVNCPANLLYNPKIKDCDWPAEVDCGDRTLPGSGGGDGPCACDARMAPTICAGAGSDGKLVAHAECSKYWVCRAGEPMARSCPPRLLYEPHSERCLWPAAVSCEGRSLSTYSSLNKHLEARRGF